MDPLASQSFARLLDAERGAAAAAMTGCARPNCTVTPDRAGEEHLSAFLRMTEFQTAFVGEMLNIGAFHREDVELGKKLTLGMVGRADYEPCRTRFAACENEPSRRPGTARRVPSRRAHVKRGLRR